MLMFLLKIYICTYVCKCMHVWMHTCPEAKERCHLVSITLSIQGRVCLSEPGASFLCPFPPPPASPSNPPVSTPLGSSITSMCGVLGLMCVGWDPTPGSRNGTANALNHWARIFITVFFICSLKAGSHPAQTGFKLPNSLPRHSKC